MEELTNLSKVDNDWYRKKCLDDTFPFQELETSELLATIHAFTDDYSELYTKCQSLNFNTATYVDYYFDNNLSSVRMACKPSEYYTECDFINEYIFI